MEKVEWKVEGMDCTNCALTINKYLNKEGLKEVKVNFIGGDVSFEMNGNITKETIAKGIKNLGYTVVDERLPDINNRKEVTDSSWWSVLSGRWSFSNHLQRFLFCLPFTLVLMLHMLPWHLHFLMNPWIQLAICLPVYFVGMSYFGVSAVKSLRRGIPNMNVLIAIGATAAFVYSLIGTLGNMGMNYVFYETTATIITLVFLGEWIEHKSVTTTQKELNKLARQQKVMANMIAFDDDHKENIFPVENTQLRVGDLILIKSGEQVPTDCKILWGDAYVNEALITGESSLIHKQKKDVLTGGSLLTDGTLKAQVTAVGKDTVLSNILNLVKQAQSEKPPLQQLADKISAVFVPTVIGISAVTFLLNYFAFGVDGTNSLMRSIAVLVISCPCAMGLATPAAIAVGLGRAARKGILFRNAKSLELFKNITTVVFDKTGTLTKGNLIISKTESNIDEQEFKQIIFSLEKYSNHPVAKAITNQWKTNNVIQWKKVEEIKGMGVVAEDANSIVYKLGSYKIAAALIARQQDEHRDRPRLRRQVGRTRTRRFARAGLHGQRHRQSAASTFARDGRNGHYRRVGRQWPDGSRRPERVDLLEHGSDGRACGRARAAHLGQVADGETRRGRRGLGKQRDEQYVDRGDVGTASAHAATAPAAAADRGGLRHHLRSDTAAAVPIGFGRGHRADACPSRVHRTRRDSNRRCEWRRHP